MKKILFFCLGMLAALSLFLLLPFFTVKKDTYQVGRCTNTGNQYFDIEKKQWVNIDR